MRVSAANLPIIVLTGHDDPDFAVTALEAGAQDYLVKSDTSKNTVVRSIRYAITRKPIDTLALYTTLNDMHALHYRQMLIEPMALSVTSPPFGAFGLTQGK